MYLASYEPSVATFLKVTLIIGYRISVILTPFHLQHPVLCTAAEVVLFFF